MLETAEVMPGRRRTRNLLTAVRLYQAESFFFFPPENKRQWFNSVLGNSFERNINIRANHFYRELRKLRRLKRFLLELLMIISGIFKVHSAYRTNSRAPCSRFRK